MNRQDIPDLLFRTKSSSCHAPLSMSGSPLPGRRPKIRFRQSRQLAFISSRIASSPKQFPAAPSLHSASASSDFLDPLEAGDVLVVTKLDLLGRDAIEVSGTVAKLEEVGVPVHCLDVGSVDLACSAGKKMTINVINAVAQFQRDLLIERTQAGLKSAKSEGKILGRAPQLSQKQQDQVLPGLTQAKSISALTREIQTSRQTIMRVRDAGSSSDVLRKQRAGVGGNSGTDPAA